jgi:hypothetical protein
MGLYLCIFDGEEELEGVEVGSYSDFGFFRKTVAQMLEDGKQGSKYPALQEHSDSDGEWIPNQCNVLVDELNEIGEAFKRLPPIKFEPNTWQSERIQSGEISLPKNLYESFFDVNDEPLIGRIIELAKISQEKRLPILFQ